ncbi:MAG: crotonase/enoyl-CoA hydratase family protein, partial [Pseudomonadota bacterium]
MTVKVEMQGEIALITMDDGKANAVNPLLLDALNTALDEAEAKAKAIVIAGRPGRFSAGFDLNILTGGSIDDAIGLVKYGGRTALRMYGSDKPIVAACPGHAIAMGSFFLLSTDYRIGTPGAFKIGANESAIGMVIPEFAAE